MKDQHELESVVKEWLDEIKPVPPRNPQMASRGRAQFLGRAVSAHELPRQKGWISIFRKERYAMNVLLSILVIAGLLFGGGATVQAAQDDLPNEPLYAVKTWTEDLSLQFQNDQEAKVNLLMELAQVRIQEMTQLAEAGEPIPDQVRLRLEQHIQQALQLCKNMDDPTLERTLLQIRDRLRDQDRDMDQLQLHTQDQLQLQTQDQLRLQTQDQLQLLTQTRTMLRERLRLVDDGLLNHEMFRYRVQNGFRFGQDDELTPPAQNGNGQQNGQPSLEPGGPNTDPGGPNLDPGGPNTDPGGPNLTPGEPNTDPGGTNTDPGGNSNDSGNGTGGTDSGGGSNDNGSGGSGKP
jgi:uncharacterized membrane protein YgcG